MDKYIHFLWSFIKCSCLTMIALYIVLGACLLVYAFI